MADNWVKLEYVRFPAECLDCNKMIYRGETAFWLPTTKLLLHPKCGLGSKPISDLLSIYTENPTYDGDPFEKTLEHTPTFYAAREWRTSRD